MKTFSLLFLLFSAFLPNIKCRKPESVEAILEVLLIQNQKLEAKLEALEEDLRKEREDKQQLRELVELHDAKLTKDPVTKRKYCYFIFVTIKN